MLGPCWSFSDRPRSLQPKEAKNMTKPRQHRQTNPSEPQHKIQIQTAQPSRTHDFQESPDIPTSGFEANKKSNIAHMECSRLLLYPILRTIFHRARHVVTSHPPVKVAPTNQGRIHQSRSHPPVKVASTSQSRIHQSESHPPVRVASTSHGLTHQSR